MCISSNYVLIYSSNFFETFIWQPRIPTILDCYSLTNISFKKRERYIPKANGIFPHLRCNISLLKQTLKTLN